MESQNSWTHHKKYLCNSEIRQIFVVCFIPPFSLNITGQNSSCILSCHSTKRKSNDVFLGSRDIHFIFRQDFLQKLYIFLTIVSLGTYMLELHDICSKFTVELIEHLDPRGTSCFQGVYTSLKGIVVSEIPIKRKQLHQNVKIKWTLCHHYT